MKKIAVILVLSIITHLAFAQAFIAAMTQVPLNTEAVVEKTDGSVVSGEIKSAMLVGGMLKSFTLKDENGIKLKFKSADVKSIKVKPGVQGKLDMISEKSSSLKEMLETDFDEIIDREWVYFEQVVSPTKSQKPVLLQKLNPGFDQLISIYNNPSANKTATLSSGDMTILGGEDRSYIAVKKNSGSFFIRKAGYDTDIREFLGDCPAFINHYDSQKLKFNNIAQHIYYYNLECK